MTRLPSPLLVVTDRTGNARPLAETVEAALAGGARWIWFRDRDLDAESRRSLAEKVIRRVRAAGARLVVGGDVALAHAIRADGVHFGGGASRQDIALARQDLPPVSLIGFSAHSPAEIVAAADAGADYVTLSPIFATASKPGYGPALGPDVLRSCDPGIPVFALGGVTPRNLASCRDAGFAGIAVMGGVMRAEDARQAACSHLNAWAGEKHPWPGDQRAAGP